MRAVTARGAPLACGTPTWMNPDVTWSVTA
jgi:hypothetical protein